MTPGSNLNPCRKAMSTSKGNYVGNQKDSIIVYFFSFLLLTDLNSNCIKQYVYNCIIKPIPHKNVIYLTITAQKRYVGTKLYWSMEMTPNGNLNPQEDTKRIRNGEKKITIISSINIYFLSFLLSATLNDVKHKIM